MESKLVEGIKESKAQSMQGIARALGSAVEKGSHARCRRYFERQMPISCLCKVAKLEAFADSLVKEAETIGLYAYWKNLEKMPLRKRTMAEQSVKNVTAVAIARLKSAAIMAKMLGYLKMNFGMVHLSQKYADAVHERYAIHTEMLRVAEALRKSKGDLVSIAEADPEVAAFLKNPSDDEKSHPFHFDEHLVSFARLVIPIKQIHRMYYSCDSDDWSMPTHRFDLPLMEEYNKLLAMHGKELPPELVERVELTLKVMQARRKIFDVWLGDRENQPEQTDIWDRIVSYTTYDARMNYVYAKEEALSWVSLAILGHPEAMKKAKSLNKLEIEKIIGYKLPEKE
ncbi:MAG: hypothetical protein NTV88_05805 [Candidatus Micrarchaeota archaeon]|nr:hypothetical protein [Candidatus Micrarchaeota archaeon]